MAKKGDRVYVQPYRGKPYMATIIYILNSVSDLTGLPTTREDFRALGVHIPVGSKIDIHYRYRERAETTYIVLTDYINGKQYVRCPNIKTVEKRGV